MCNAACGRARRAIGHGPFGHRASPGSAGDVTAVEVAAVEVFAGAGQDGRVRLTDFWERLETVLGPAYARSWAHDVVLPPLGLTVEQAIAAGIDTKEIWRAVCQVADVPATLV